MSTASPPLLDARLLRKLERVALTARRPYAGRMKGENRSIHRGASVEFADYREYLSGDDLRYVDWNTAARLERHYIRLYVEEEDLPITLIVDTSASMGFGEPSKLTTAAQLAGALGYMGLMHHDQVRLVTAGQQLSWGRLERKGRAGAPGFLARVSSLSPSGEGNLGATLRKAAGQRGAAGLAFVFSDLMDADWKAGVGQLLAAKHQVCLLHVLSQAELTPDVKGDLCLIDSETGQERELSVSQPLLDRYQAALRGFCDDAQSWCRKYGVDYFAPQPNHTLEEVILKWMRRGGLVR